MLEMVPVELDLFGLTSTFTPGKLVLPGTGGARGNEPRAAAAASDVELVP
ncbi:hypothetical protein EST38_g1796 [Candolleomyces aberdarensis]|uniref:Uncharacterized protein n=1 Tax=Candolleomyces aberdarensis TaxID=2316362 RepID=A0A4Q2DYD6_9AGAR|nr:hypothetical protein EST38_g1796 [Candolleomyces aberdarensis]